MNLGLGIHPRTTGKGPHRKEDPPFHTQGQSFDQNPIILLVRQISTFIL